MEEAEKRSGDQCSLSRPARSRHEYFIIAPRYRSALPSSFPFFFLRCRSSRAHRVRTPRIPLSSRAAYTPPPPVSPRFLVSSPIAFYFPPPLHSLARAFHPLLVVRRHLFAACALRGGGRSLRGAGCLRPSDAPFAGCERQEGKKQGSGGGTPGGVQVQVHAYRRQ